MSSAASAVAGSPAAGAAPSAAPAAADLRVTTNPLPASRVALEVEIPASLSLASYEAAIEQLGRSVRLPGFRKGRVPRVVLLQQLGPLRVRATALENLVDRVCRDALAREEVAAIGRPELSEAFDVVLERYDPGSDLTITLELDVEPQPSLRATKGLTAEAEAVSHDPGRVEELIEQTRRQLATLVPVEGRAAREGDVAVVAFSGTFTDTGKPIEGGSGDALEVELEQGRMIPGFVEGVIGMEVGESRSVDCRFPESYPQEEAAGREARFAITLQELKARELPALDDAFAQQAGEKETLAELRADLETRLREDSERRARAARHEALLNALVEQLEVDLPETLIREEIGNLIEQTAGRISQQGGDVKKLFTPDLVRSLMDTSRPQAELQLRRRLALRALAEAEQISVEDEVIERRVREISRSLSQQGTIDLERLRAAVADELLRETLLEWLESNSTIIEKAASPAEDANAEPGAAKASTGGNEQDAGAPPQA